MSKIIMFHNQAPADLLSCQVPHTTLIITKAHVSVSMFSEVTNDKVLFNIFCTVS